MRKFLTRLSIFVLPVVVLAYPLDLFISRNLAHSTVAAYGEYLVWNDIFNGDVNADVVIYGSSRAWVHFDSKLLSDSLHRSVYNLGIDGHNFWMQYLRHRELLKYNKKPKFIIVSVDIFSLQKKPELYNLPQFLPYALWDSDIEQFTSSYKGFSKWDYKLPLIRFTKDRNSIKTALKVFLKGDTSKPARIRGYMGKDRIWNDDFDKARLKMDFYEGDTDAGTISLFNQFLMECNSAGIKVLLVYSPEYIEGQKFVKNREFYINMFKDFGTRYHLLFLDYSTDPICYDKKYFYNASHLNKTGSKLFTKKLLADLKASNKQTGIFNIP